MNATDRFTGLADVYAQNRPQYPAAAIDFIVEQTAINSKSLIADLGCGTGISSLIFARRGFNIIGVEPNRDMREKAFNSIGQKAISGRLKFIEGTGEHTGLPDNSINLILCAQSFHWFNSKEAFLEFDRVLVSDGYVVLMWNERSSLDPFTKKYGELMLTAEHTKSVEMRFAVNPEELFKSSPFACSTLKYFDNQQTLTLEGLLGRAFSASYAPKEDKKRQEWREDLTMLFHDYKKISEDGLPKVSLIYNTSVYIAQRA